MEQVDENGLRSWLFNSIQEDVVFTFAKNGPMFEKMCLSCLASVLAMCLVGYCLMKYFVSKMFTISLSGPLNLQAHPN